MSAADHGDHGHGHGGSRFIQHHYDDAQHQFDSGKLGIWLFLAQEVLFFSALFVAYILYRVHHPEIYLYAHKYLDVKMGAINTAVLITSSLTAAWAVRCAQLNQKRGLIFCIVVTILCAITFMVVKYKEYSHKYHEQILFGEHFDPCVASGGAELLTKSNECPGSKSTVEWKKGSAKPEAGCFEIATVDQDPQTEGIQAKCKVFELHMAQRGKDLVEASRKEIVNQCPEEEFAHHEDSNEAGNDTPTETKKHEQPAKFPCWRPAVQPAVCADLTSGEALLAGAASKPQMGILVEYGDHEERGEDVKIKAECEAPPKKPTEGDIFADKPTTLQVGKAAIKPAHIVSEHEAFERATQGPPPPHTNMFFTIYFAMTGLHGIHVLFGIGVFIWLLIRAMKGHFTPDYFGPVDFAALYWHIVDLIWIFLFPLLYLIH